MLKANAVLPIKFVYGSFWIINNDFLMMYFDLIVLRIFDDLTDFEK